MPYAVVSKTGNVAAPASGATVTLWDSLAQAAGNSGSRAKAIVVNVESSHDSATDGVQISESDDNGTTWKTVYTRTYTVAVDGRLKLVYKLIGAPDVRVRYINSANALTTWRYSVLVDISERG